MDLEAARGVKQEIWSFLGKTRHSERDRLRFEEGTQTFPELAIGIARAGRPGQFHVAVRAESEADLTGTLIAEIRRRTASEVDVRYTGPIRPFAARYVAPATRPLTIGASVAHYNCTAGTLGFFARRSRDGAIGMVSNNHVIAASDIGNDGDDVLQPAPADHGTRTHHVVASLAGDYPRLRQSPALVDCAFARLVSGVEFDPAPGRHKLAPVSPWPSEELMVVCKIGRTTHHTTGCVTAFELDHVRVSYPFGSISFMGQIEIESTESVPFSRPGDSGSLIFTSAGRQPVGLLVGSSMRGGTANLGLTYVNPLHSVLSALGVTVVT